ncbi:MAG TPA: PHP domain-containing protein [Thermomicrobiales bacterium]|nr:PHP domain-containing protein [Thermomicrobiales bacterium]
MTIPDHLVDTTLTLPADAPVDLHLHTFVSDGIWHPRDLVDRLVQDGIRVAAVCDHDNQRSVVEAIAYGERRGVRILPGIECTVRWDGRQWHMLVYGIRPDDERPEARAFLDLVARQDDIFQHLAHDARQRVEASGRPIPTLLTLERHGPLMPVHVLRAMIADKHVPRLKEAAELVVELGGHFTTDTPLAEVVVAAHEGGGVCIIAHPGRADLGPAMDEDSLDRMLADAPVDGIECHYRTYTDRDTAFYRGLADARGLLIGTGSDSHGPGVPVDPRPFHAAWASGLLGRFGFEVVEPYGPVWEPGMDPNAVQEKDDKS